MNIEKFSLGKRPDRKHVLQWLSANIDKYPEHPDKYIGPDLFHGWRFIVSLEGILYFANCIEPGICEVEFEVWRLQNIA